MSTGKKRKRSNENDPLMVAHVLRKTSSIDQTRWHCALIASMSGTPSGHQLSGDHSPLTRPEMVSVQGTERC